MQTSQTLLGSLIIKVLIIIGLVFSVNTAFAELYISEYAESSNYHDQYIEVTNGGDSTIDLRDYSILSCTDKCTTHYEKYAPYNHSDGANYDFHLIQPGQSFVLARSAATNTTIENNQDGQYQYLYFSGNDAIALVKEESGFTAQSFKTDSSVYTVIDVVGELTTGATATTWSVCGVSAATKDKTLIKKPGKTGNTDWTSSRGTNADDCDWIVKNDSDFGDIGEHTATLKVWDFNGTVHDFTTSNNGTIASGTTYATLTLESGTSGSARYPNLDNTVASIGTSSDYIAVTMQNNSTNTKFVIGINRQSAATTQWVPLTDIPTEETDFTTRYFDMSNSSEWTGSDHDDITLRIQAVNGSVGVNAGTIYIDEIAILPAVDTTAPTLSSVAIASDNTTPTKAKVGDTISLTFTASESIRKPTVTFTSGGDAITNSPSYNHVSGDTWTASYIVASADSEGSVAYSIAFTDTSSNSGTAVTSGTGSVTVDTTAPTLAAVTAISTPTTDNTPSFVFSSNEAGTITTTISEGFSTSSSVSSGENTITFNTLGDGTYSGRTITVTDSSGNGDSLTIADFVVDTTGPTMVITSSTVSDDASSNNSSIALTFTSNEPTTNFVLGDITVQGGSLSSFEPLSSTVYTATFTPSGDGATTIDVSANSFTDALGNNNSAASQFNWTYDGTAPTLATVAAISTPGNDSTPSFVFSSDEAGTISSNLSEGFSSSSSVSSGDNTITFNTLGDGTYSGKVITVTDSVGNANSLTIPDFVIETVAPTITISSSTVSDGDTSNDESIDLIFSSSEATTNFGASDVTVSGGSIGNFASSSTSVYTATFTPSSAGATSIDVRAGVFTDSAGNGNTAASQFNWTFDNSSAELSKVKISSDNENSTTLARASNTITLIFYSNETINTPAVSFSSGGSAIASNRVSVSNAQGTNWSGSEDPNFWNANYIVDPSDSDGAVTYSIAFSDTGGNAGVPVTSGSGSVTVDNTRPTIWMTSGQVGDGESTRTKSIDFTFYLSEEPTGFDQSDISVSGGTLSNLSGSGTSYSATFTPDGDGTSVIRVPSGSFADATGNLSWGGDFSYTYDGTFPTVDISNMYSKIIDGMTDLGSVTADEDVTWSISGVGVSISSSGIVTLDTAADHLVAESHTFTISAMDSVGNNSHYTMTVQVEDVTAPAIDYSNLLHHIDEGETALGYVTSTEPVTWSVEGDGVSISDSGVLTLDVAAKYEDAPSHRYRVTAVDDEGIFRRGYIWTVFVNDNTAPVITLQGSASVDVELGYEYIDEGATAYDNAELNITSRIVTNNPVDIDVEGVYQVTYDVSDSAGNAATQVVRTVTVTPDATVPVITLSGEASLTVEAATSYSDAGASASDNIDGDISENIVTVNNVDINVPGTYMVSYNVDDSAGNSAVEVSRTVEIVDTTAPVITLGGGSSQTTTVESPYSTNDPMGNGPDGSANTADDVIIKDLYAVDGLTFVRPPLGAEAAAGTWGTAAGRDLNRVGTNRYFRKFTWEKARDWCVSISARLATGAEVTSHIIPIVGPSSDGTWESELNWPQQASHYWTGSVAGDDNGSESRHKAFITYNTGNGNSVHQVQGRANTNAFWPMCVMETETTTTEGSASITHEQGTTYVDSGATALDAVDGVIEVETTGSVDDATAGTYVLTYTATDNAGNSATKDRTVTVTDTVSPVITLIGDAALSFEVAPSGTVYEDAGATATDGADGDLTSSIVVTGTVDLTTVGTYTLTYSLTDAAGNQATTVTRTITVTPDVTVPTITLLGDSAQSYEMGTAYVDAGATAADNIDGDITSQIVLTISNSSGTTLSSVDILTPDTYTLTYSVEDATGNAAVSVIRIIEITPDVTIPVITLVGESSITLERYTPYVDSGATATDNIDGDITSSIVTINSVDTTKVGTYVITYNVSDGYGNAAAEVSRTVTIIPIAISLSAPSDITVNATGHLTYVDIGSASVSAGEGEVTVSPSRMGPFESGMYEVTWTAEDSVGTTAVALQKVKVIPMVNLGPAMTVTEGNSLQIPVSLSGHLADASMSVNYLITGTAIETEDYLSAGTAVTIEGSDMAAMINIDIVSDAVAESDETLTITLIPESLTGAGPGSTMEQTITISEQDLPPKVSMHASQASVMPITTVAKDSGMVDVVASASDPNSGSSFTYTWGGAYNTLPGVIDNGNTLSFDPSTMDSGVISVSVEVSDGVNTTMASILLNIVTSMPTLSADNDSDGDGVDDLTEGVGDDDMDGVPNYLDSITSSNVIPTASSVAQSEAGTSISLGAIALGNGDHDVSVSEADVALIDTADVGFDYIELSDFVISGAQPGHSYMVTIPLSVASSSTATYRKYVNENIGWQMFVEDASNMIMSADSSNGVCPAAGSDEYGPGWYIGDDCLQLMIEDGGPNDADGVANGVVIDPSGVAEKFIGTPSSNSSAVLGTNTLDANGTDSTSLTVTVLDGSGNPLEHMSVSGSIGISGATVSAFYEEGEGVYSATVTAGTVAGSDSVSIDISNGQTSVTISSDQLTLNDVTPVTPEEPATGGGGGCSVSTDTSSDNTLIMMLLAAALLLIRRRYYQNQ